MQSTLLNGLRPPIRQTLRWMIIVGAAISLPLAFAIEGDGNPAPASTPDIDRVNSDSAIGVIKLVNWQYVGTNSEITATRYKLQRAVSKNLYDDYSVWTDVATLARTTTSYTDTNLVSGVYRYRIRACTQASNCVFTAASDPLAILNKRVSLNVKPNLERQKLYRNSSLDPNAPKVQGLDLLQTTAAEYFSSIAPGSYLLADKEPGQVEDAPYQQEKSTFSNWLRAQSKDLNNPVWYSAHYYNRADLGLGRGMYCASNATKDKASCYVVNCGSVRDQDGELNDELSNAFGCQQDEKDRAEFDINETTAKEIVLKNATNAGESIGSAEVIIRARALIKALIAGHPVAVVAMEWRKGDVQPVKFFAFDYRRNAAVGKVPLDLISAQENNYPSNCLTCHGDKNGVERNRNGRLVGISKAHFLPFDSRSVLRKAGVTEEQLQNQFAPLNAIVRQTEESAYSSITLAINQYLNPKATQQVSTQLRMASTPLPPDKPVAPLKWYYGTAHGNQSSFYKAVVRPYCASCHQARGTVVGSPDEFFQDSVASRVCFSDHDMPKSEMAEIGFYSDDAARILLRNTFLEKGIVCNL